MGSVGVPTTGQATTAGAGGSASPPPGKSNPSLPTDESSPGSYWASGGTVCSLLDLSGKPEALSNSPERTEGTSTEWLSSEDAPSESTEESSLDS